MVHEVELRQYADCALSRGIHMPCQLEGFRIDDINIGRGDSEDDAVGLGNILRDEIAGLLLDVCGLISNGNLGIVLAMSHASGLYSFVRVRTFVNPGRSTSVSVRT